jgi:hypothetical protein
MQKSENLNGFDSNYWSVDEYGNVVYGKYVIFESEEWLEKSDSHVNDYNGWIPIESLE